LAADLNDSPPAVSSEPGPDVEEGPEALKKQVRITVETNLLAGASVSNSTAPREKTFQWKVEWRGWNGLYVELIRNTFLGQVVPSITNYGQLYLGVMFQPRTNSHSIKLFHLEENRLTARFGGRVAVDGAAYLAGSQFQDFDSGIELRRALFFARGDGLLLFPFSYSIELGYNHSSFFLDETYLKFPNIPLIGDFKIGDFKAPMSLEQLTSSRDITFMEQPAPIQALAPGNSSGFEIGRPVFDQRATWSMGLFTQGVGYDVGDASTDYGRAILRITALPLWSQNENGAQKLLHLGVSANVLFSGNSTVQYRSRPESYLAPYVVDTGKISADGAVVVGAEIAWVDGPFSIQGETMSSWVDETDGGVPNFNGFYGSASWFLTGESRPYNRADGIFGRLIPNQNFNFGHGGWGALELAARVSYIDLNSGDVHGGRTTMLMGGVNWYLTPHIRWRFNYGLAQVRSHSPQGNVNIFQTRIEVDF
jgi:phosphate-selective porin OprO/OprP